MKQCLYSLCVATMKLLVFIKLDLRLVNSCWPYLGHTIAILKEHKDLQFMLTWIECLQISRCKIRKSKIPNSSIQTNYASLGDIANEIQCRKHWLFSKRAIGAQKPHTMYYVKLKRMAHHCANISDNSRP